MNYREPRWQTNRGLSRYLNLSPATIGRWQKKPEMNFPTPACVGGVLLTDLNLIDEWMEQHKVKDAKTLRGRKPKAA